MLASIAFYVLSVIAVISALAVITVRNPVHSVLFLILTFFTSAGLFVLLGAEFLAMLLVVVYVGAVAVLFLFVVMMLDIDFAELRSGLARYGLFGALIALVLVGEMIVAEGAWSAGTIQLAQRTAPVPADMSNIEAMGAIIYSRYLYVFEAAGLVLLVAMIGAIVLTHRERRDSRPQNISQQVRRRPQDAVRITNPAVGQGVEL